MSKIIKTQDEKFSLRFAEEKDTKIILGFIRELAEYVNSLDEVVTTEEVLKDSLFNRKVAEVIIAEYDNEPVGYALFFYSFSTFLGIPGIFLEDLYIQPHMRGKGLGGLLLSYIAQLTLERNCGRLEWECRDWNENSIKFYKHLGAIPKGGSTVYRVTDNTLDDLANRHNKCHSS